MNRWIALLVAAALTTLAACSGEYDAQLKLASQKQCLLVAAKAKAKAAPDDMDAKEEVLRQQRAIETHAELSGDGAKLLKALDTVTCP